MAAYRHITACGILWLVVICHVFSTDPSQYDGDYASYYQLLSEMLKPIGPSIVSSPTWEETVGSLPFGQVSGVDVDRDGNLYVLHRADRVWDRSTFNSSNVLQQQTPIDSDVLLKMDSNTGRLLDSWGKGMFYLPHGLTVDDKGNVWVTDVGSHQVMKFEPGSKEAALVLGTRLVPGDDSKHFCKPTSVAVSTSGEFFIADGYCNSRILRYSADGKITKQWGEPSGALSVFMGDTVGTGTFNTPHGLALAEDHDILCVADRENSRIQCFSAGLKDATKTGDFAYEIDDKELGRVYDIAYHPDEGGVLYAISGHSFVGKPRPAHGSVISMRSKEILDTWVPQVQSGFGTPHTIAVTPGNDALFVGETNPSGGVLWKFVPTDEALGELNTFNNGGGGGGNGFYTTGDEAGWELADEEHERNIFMM